MSLVGWRRVFALGRMLPVLSMRRTMGSPISVEQLIVSGAVLEWVTSSSWSQRVFSVRFTTFQARSATGDQ